MLSSFTISNEEPLESSRLFEGSTGSRFAVFHISSAVLDSVSDTKVRARLVVQLERKYKNEEITLAILSPDDCVSLDLYVHCTQEV